MAFMRPSGFALGGYRSFWERALGFKCRAIRVQAFKFESLKFDLGTGLSVWVQAFKFDPSWLGSPLLGNFGTSHGTPGSYPSLQTDPANT